jgi:hypothetical protein
MKHLVPTLLLSAFVAQLSAQSFIVQPIAAADGNGAPFDGNNLDPAGTINGSGLSDATIVQTGDAVPVTLPTHAASPFGIQWRNRDGSQADNTISFDLGTGSTSYDITGLYVWNYNEAFSGFQTQRGFNVLTIEWSSNDGANWSTVGSVDGFAFTEALPQNDNAPQFVSLGSTLSGATDIRFIPTSNHGDSRYYGLNEVRFVAVPEPSTIVLMTISIVALIGFRRRKK